MTLPLVLALIGLAPSDRIVVEPSGKGFIHSSTKSPFVPWGFNYDHDETGRLIEDYWEAEWPKVVEDFQEMKDLGANVVRVHLQVSRFLKSPTQADAKSLDRLAKLLKLAESTKLYLDLTGLGCYHKADVPKWYDALSEAERWKAQATFWRSVAETCKDSPAVFCYDLMNEPVVSGSKRDPADWLAGAFGGKHFVQFINLEASGRTRPEIAKAWIEMLTKAVREVDRTHLITVGLVDWSLDRPGLTSGFVPKEVTGPLDFLCVHLYPETGKAKEASETLDGFAAVGKPVVIEETFPLRSSLPDFRRFLRESKPRASGWIGFYWGKTRAQCRESKSIGDAITGAWLDVFQEEKAAMTRP